MRNGIFFCVLAASLLSACASTSNVRLRDTVGTWYNVATQEGRLVHGLNDLRADGTFLIHFFVEDNCRLAPFSVEAGRWAISNGLYTSLTTEVDGKSVDVNDRYYRDVYRIEEFSGDRMVYTSGTPVIKFTARRVAEDFVPSPVHACTPSLQIETH